MQENGANITLQRIETGTVPQRNGTHKVFKGQDTPSHTQLKRDTLANEKMEHTVPQRYWTYHLRITSFQGKGTKSLTTAAFQRVCWLLCQTTKTVNLCQTTKTKWYWITINDSNKLTDLQWNEKMWTLGQITETKQGSSPLAPRHLAGLDEALAKDVMVMNLKVQVINVLHITTRQLVSPNQSLDSVYMLKFIFQCQSVSQLDRQSNRQTHKWLSGR